MKRKSSMRKVKSNASQKEKRLLLVFCRNIQYNSFATYSGDGVGCDGVCGRGSPLLLTIYGE
jgi:hypothetical protein